MAGQRLDWTRPRMRSQPVRRVAASPVDALRGVPRVLADGSPGGRSALGTAEELEQLVEVAHATGSRCCWIYPPITCTKITPWSPTRGTIGLTIRRRSVDVRFHGTAPETCWFTEYLPDLNLANGACAAWLVDQALWVAERFGVDGFRIDVEHLDRRFERPASRAQGTPRAVRAAVLDHRRDLLRGRARSPRTSGARGSFAVRLSDEPSDFGGNLRRTVWVWARWINRSGRSAELQRRANGQLCRQP